MKERKINIQTSTAKQIQQGRKIESPNHHHFFAGDQTPTHERFCCFQVKQKGVLIYRKVFQTKKCST